MNSPAARKRNMSFEATAKLKDRVMANMASYDDYCRSFSWEAVTRDLDGLPGGRGLNIAYEAVDRHAAGAKASHLAMRFLRRNGKTDDYTYKRLAEESSKFANVLKALDIAKGDRVFALAGRIPELYIAAIGTLKNQSVFCPLFSAFGPEPIRMRIALGDARVLITTRQLYERKIAGIRNTLGGLKHIIVIGDETPTEIPGTLDIAALMSTASTSFEIDRTDPEDIALLHFTSGTTGTPKGAIHVHAAVAAHHITGKLALDLHENDIFWCTADPGWVTGTSYGIISPLTNGVTSIVDEAEFDAERWYQTLQDEKVTVWYSAPTAIRMLMKAGDEIVKNYDLSNLRFLSSVGEPLNPEAVLWSQRVFGRPFHDNWWQTETGGIMIAKYASMKLKPGSRGKPLPGIKAAVVRQTQTGRVEEVIRTDEQGELALRPDFPSLFRGYLNEPSPYRKCFSSGFYLTGDLARKDADGYFWFVGRKDDVIKTSGHLAR